MSKEKLKEKKNMKKALKANVELFQNDVEKDEERNRKVKQVGKKKRKREGAIGQIAKKLIEAEGEIKKKKPNKSKRKNEDKRIDLIGTKDEDGLNDQYEQMIEAERGSKKNKPKKKKRKNGEKNSDMMGKSDLLGTDHEDGFSEQQEEQMTKVEGENMKNKSKKKKRKNGKKKISLTSESSWLQTKDEGGLEEHDDGAADQSLYIVEEDANDFREQSEALTKTHTKNRKSKKSKKKKEHDTSKGAENVLENREETVMDDVYHISSGEEDCSKGMQKWLTEYHQSRPGLKVLQQRIDDFIIAHEEKLEQERRERQARNAEEGWTVVVHHKGRKKTTDSESGITVGSVAPAVAGNQLAKKKNKEVGVDFYRFQKREAQRNEILALQSKFEQDKKRIQQLRAARKFKPY